MADNVIFVNVYGPHSVHEKNDLWLELIQIKNNIDGIWLFCGDFNTVRRRDERSNSVFCPNSAASFNLFISQAGLHDYNMGGSKFTYMSRVGAKLSKLDRFLVCSEFLSKFPSAVVTANVTPVKFHRSKSTIL